MKETMKRKCCGDCRKGKVGLHHACQIKLDLEQVKKPTFSKKQQVS